MRQYSPDFPFYAGETWTFQGTARDYAGNPFDLSGGTVNVRLHQMSGSGFMDRDASIVDEAGGGWLLEVSPADQETDGLVADFYIYVVRVTLASGLVSVQSTGIMEVLSTPPVPEEEE